MAPPALRRRYLVRQGGLPSVDPVGPIGAMNPRMILTVTDCTCHRPIVPRTEPDVKGPAG